MSSGFAGTQGTNIPVTSLPLVSLRVLLVLGWDGVRFPDYHVSFFHVIGILRAWSLDVLQ